MKQMKTEMKTVAKIRKPEPKLYSIWAAHSSETSPTLKLNYSYELEGMGSLFIHTNLAVLLNLLLGA